MYLDTFKSVFTVLFPWTAWDYADVKPHFHFVLWMNLPIWLLQSWLILLPPLMQPRPQLLGHLLLLYYVLSFLIMWSLGLSPADL